MQDSNITQETGGSHHFSAGTTTSSNYGTSLLPTSEFPSALKEGFQPQTSTTFINSTPTDWPQWNMTIEGLLNDSRSEWPTAAVVTSTTLDIETIGTIDHLTMTSSYWNMNSVVDGHLSDFEPASTMEVVLLSCIFCFIGFIGILGNSIVIYVVVAKASMRRTVTNLFILNLSIADALIMLCGVPDIVMFMISRGWLMGDGMCKGQRYVLLVALYTSVLTLVAVSVERYIAIVHPFRAHMWCSRRRAIITVCCIWPAAMTVGLPPLLFNEVKQPANNVSVQYCILNFPGDHEKTYMFYKYLEFFIFYLTPFLLQIILYSVIGKRLFANTKTLYPRKTFRTIRGKEQLRINDAIAARRSVVKMLMTCVFIYFISYSPSEVVLLYNTFSATPFHQTWAFVVFIMSMAYVNSAANPILYCVFSQKFRKEFSKMMCRRKTSRDDQSRSTSIHTLASPNLSTKMSLVGCRLQSYDTRNVTVNERRHTVM